MQDVIKMPIQTMDRLMDAWEEQIKSPSSSSTILSKLGSSSSFGSAAGWPSAAVTQMAAFNPFGAYMQIVQQWQKEAMGFWTKAGRPN